MTIDERLERPAERHEASASAASWPDRNHEHRIEGMEDRR
jgi:hypothetical protein